MSPENPCGMGNEDDSVQFVPKVWEVVQCPTHTHTHPSISNYGYLRIKLLILFFLSI